MILYSFFTTNCKCGLFCFSLFLLCFTFIPAASVNAELYIWTDENGIQHFSNTAPLVELENVVEEKEIGSSSFSDELPDSEFGSDLENENRVKQKKGKYGRSATQENLIESMLMPMRKQLVGIYKTIHDGDVQKVNAMLDSNPSLVKNDNGNYWSPFEFSIACGNIDIIRSFINKGAVVNCKNHKVGVPPLNLAVVTADIDIVKLLIDSRANINTSAEGKYFSTWAGNWALNRAYGTPLHAAVANLGDKRSVNKEQAVAMVEFLLKHGANPSIKNVNGLTPYEYGVKIYKRDILDSIYGNHGINIPHIDYTFNELKYFASVKTYEDRGEPAIAVTKKMINEAPSYLLKQKSQTGKTLLHYAVDARKKEIVLLLLDKGLDVNAADKNGLTPLHTGISNMEIVRMLIAKGANVNAVDNSGQTALHKIATSVYNKKLEDIVVFLKQNNAQLNIQDKKGMTPAQYAMEHSQKMVALLSGRQ